MTARTVLFARFIPLPVLLAALSGCMDATMTWSDTSQEEAEASETSAPFEGKIQTGLDRALAFAGPSTTTAGFKLTRASLRGHAQYGEFTATASFKVKGGLSHVR